MDSQQSLSSAGARQQCACLKLIELYEHHECLWNYKHKDFLNIPLKDEIWASIARDLGGKVSVAFLKKRIHTMRYMVNLEKMHQREAALVKDVLAPTKLYYSDHFKFLNRIFMPTKLSAVLQQRNARESPPPHVHMVSSSKDHTPIVAGFNIDSSQKLRHSNNLQMLDPACRMRIYTQMRNDRSVARRTCHELYKKLCH